MSSDAQPSHLSIGEVLSLVQQEFPDVSISKIRFLESQGLIAPERTASGFRKFYNSDIQRLRWILRQQSDHFLPLKVIKKMLDEGTDTLPSGSKAGTQPTLWSSPDASTGNETRSSTEDADAGAASAAVDGTGPDSTKRSASADTASHSAKEPNAHRSSAHPSVVSAAFARAATGSQGREMKTSDDAPADKVPERTGSGPKGSATKGSATKGSATKGPGPDTPMSGDAVLEESSGPSGPDSEGSGTSSPEQPQSAAQRTISTPADIVAALQEDPRPKGSRRNPPPRSLDRPRVRSFSADDISTPADDSEYLSAEEVCELFDVGPQMLDELESFGLLSPRKFAGISSYDAPDVEIIGMAVRYASLGVEARHLRMYKIAAEREAGFIEQLVVPLLKQRNPTARQNASERSSELASMGNELHNLILKRHLRRLLGHR